MAGCCATQEVCSEPERMIVETIAWISIAVAFACALWIALDEIRHPQAMAVMTPVWPVTALYFSVFAVWAYYRVARKKTKAAMSGSNMGSMSGHHHQTNMHTPTVEEVAVGASHLRSRMHGCRCFLRVRHRGRGHYSSWIGSVGRVRNRFRCHVGVRYCLPACRNQAHAEVECGTSNHAAIKADTLSILAFQIGMYAWMAFVFFKLFPHPHLTPFQPQY